MTTLVLRGGALAGALLATLAAGASAAPSIVRPQGLIDVSSNGRYVLLSDGTVVDRSTGDAIMGQVPLSGGGLADTAPLALGRDLNGGLYLRTVAKPRGTLVSIGPNGTAVPAGPAVLVQNGTALVFSTTESPSRILKRDLTTGTTITLMSRASLLDASEDGRVITYARQTAAATPPPGRTPLSGDPGTAASGQVIGYQVDGGAPHIVDVTRFSERPASSVAEGECATSVAVDWTRPTNLRVTQDGAQGGSYSLVEDVVATRAPYPFATTITKRLTQTDATNLAVSDGKSSSTTVTLDPVSGAFATIRLAPVVTAPLANSAYVLGDGGSARLSIPLPAGSTDEAALFLHAIPFNGGAGVAYAAVPRATNAGATYVDDALELAADSYRTPWTTLPRNADSIDDGGRPVEGDWYTCTPTAPVPGAFGDYAAFAPKTTGNSAGTLTVTPAPDGKVTLATVRATVSWGGAALWTRTSTGQSLTLPPILPGVRGFALTVAVTLTDGTRLTQRYALRRTR